jgi:hypothetical protein
MDYRLILQICRFLANRLALVASEPDRGDVAEKIVIVGIFVALAVAVGALITTAVSGDATNISKTISTAQN